MPKSGLRPRLHPAQHCVRFIMRKASTLPPPPLVLNNVPFQSLTPPRLPSKVIAHEAMRDQTPSIVAIVQIAGTSTHTHTHTHTASYPSPLHEQLCATVGTGQALPSRPRQPHSSLLYELLRIPIPAAVAARARLLLLCVRGAGIRDPADSGDRGVQRMVLQEGGGMASWPALRGCSRRPCW